jgi:6-phosphogluconolactonase/glucosamine-6-phosphate isomerase/deaminase
MEIIATDNPAKQAGEYISEVLASYEGSVVCLLSGGSALDIIPYISKPADKPECRTIFMMGDERGSRDAKINNSLQLTTKYPDSFVSENLILTVPQLTENLEDFTSRISNTFSTEIYQLINPKIIQVLGVGSDGHTAGIFPMPKEQFGSIYERDLDIVPVHLEGLKIDFRASVTPNWIRSQPDQLIGYITGAGKKLILESLVNETKEIHERPAELIKQHQHSIVYTDQGVISTN